MPSFNGTLVFEPASLSAAGYTIELLYQHTVVVDGTNVSVSELVFAAAAESGEFVLTIPEGHAVLGAVRVRVKDPTGATVHEEESGVEALDGIRIQLTTPPRAVIRPIDPGRKGITRIISGHAISESGQPLPVGVPVTIWGRLLGSSPEADLVLLVATTLNHNGFFSLPWQSDRLEEGIAFVRDSDEIRIPLDENDRLPLRIVLVVDNEFASRLSPDTSLATVTPRLPTEQDLTENSSVFSQDLGSECVQINRPNRVLEEFPYRFVVRVTEPQIRQLSQGGKPLTNVRALDRIVEYLRTVWINTGGKAEEFTLKSTDLTGLDDKTLKDLLATLSVDSLNDDAERLGIFKQLRQIIDLVRKGQAVPGRTVLNSFNAIDWDDTPTLHEAASVAVGHVLHYRQVWRADGYKKQLGDFRDTQADLKNTKFKIDVAIQTLRLKISTLRLEARVKQLEVEKQFFADETRKLSDKEEQLRKQISDEKENELQYARQLHSSLLEVWEVDQKELQRRAELLKDEQQNVQGLLAPVEEKIKYLREIGITRTTKGFLLWAGYTAFAGVGSLIGSLLQQRQKNPSEADLLGNFIRGFAEFFGLQANSVFSWVPFLRMLSFLGAALVFLVTIVLLCDFLLRRFSRRWKSSYSPNSPRSRTERPARSWTEFLSMLTTGSDRLALFTGKITRSDYVQLLAIIPYVALASVLLFLLSALGLIIPIPTAPGSLAATITSASIGAVFTLLGTSVCLLYATRVIEPRWKRLIGAQATPGRWAYLKANWEFGVLMFVMVAVMLVLTFLPLTERNNYWTWGLVALFMTIGSIGLAYGLIYHGVFRDYDYLTRRHDAYLLKIEEHVLKPTLNDVFEATDTQELEETAQRYRKAREYLDGLRIENEMSGLFSEDHPEYESLFSQFWFAELDPQDSRPDVFDLRERGRRKLYRLIRRLGWRRSTPPPTPKTWWRAAPESMEQLKAHEDEIGRYQTHLRDIDVQLSTLDQDRLATEAKIETTRLDLRVEEARLSIAENECAAKLREINLHRQKEEIVFTSAFLTGSFVHEYLSKKKPETSPQGAEV